MKIIKDKIEISELREICKKGPFVDLIKAVVDIDKNILAINSEIHAELMELLIKEENSEPKNLWGINILPNEKNENFIIFDSLINLKPGVGNKTRGIESSDIREKITKIVTKMVIP